MRLFDLCGELNGGPLEKQVYILLSKPVNMTLFWKGVFADVIKLGILDFLGGP